MSYYIEIVCAVPSPVDDALYSEHVRRFTIVMSYLFPHPWSLVFYIVVLGCARICLIFFVLSNFSPIYYDTKETIYKNERKKTENGTNTRARRTRLYVHRRRIIRCVVLMKISWTPANYDRSGATNRVQISF